MTHGLSTILKWMTFKPTKPRPSGPSRDRTLRGKARVRARKAAQRAARQAQP